MDVSRETPDVTTKPKCYDLTNILYSISVWEKQVEPLVSEKVLDGTINFLSMIDQTLLQYNQSTGTSRHGLTVCNAGLCKQTH